LCFLGGPNPKEVAMQYAQKVGLPAMMYYWHFGFLNCRYAYYDIYQVAKVVANYSAANVPLETQRIVMVGSSCSDALLSFVYENLQIT
jgi:alpha-glucosidase